MSGGGSSTARAARRERRSPSAVGTSRNSDKWVGIGARQDEMASHFEPRRHAKYNLILPCTLARSTRIVYVVQLSTLEGGEVRVGDLYGF